MKRTRALLLAAIVLSLGGAFLSWLLLNKHMRMPGAPDWLNAICESGQEGGYSCDQVLDSPWATIPPTREGDPADKLRFPVAGLGLAYFVMLLTWFVGVGRPSYASRRWHLLPVIVNALGLLGSIGFVGLMAFSLDTWCPLCVATHVINAALLVVNILLRPRPSMADQPPEGIPDVDTEALAALARQRHPSPRLALVVVVLGVMLIGTLNQGSRIKRLLLQNKKMRAILVEMQSSTQTLVTAYRAEKRQEIDIRPDDPIRHDGPGLPVMVVWSDFQCAACAKFARDFEDKYYREFDGHLRIVYKHFPLCKDCNKYVRTRTHAYACKAARLAEAVRLQGGSDKFWKAHDMLFECQGKLKDMDPLLIAAALELDPARLVADMNSADVKNRVAEDVELGHSLGVNATPAVFLDGRKVGSLAKNTPAFWREMGKLARAAREKVSG